MRTTSIARRHLALALAFGSALAALAAAGALGALTTAIAIAGGRECRYFDRAKALRK